LGIEKMMQGITDLEQQTEQWALFVVESVGDDAAGISGGRKPTLYIGEWFSRSSFARCWKPLVFFHGAALIGVQKTVFCT
jgi:hypothetical protein